MTNSAGPVPVLMGAEPIGDDLWLRCPLDGHEVKVCAEAPDAALSEMLDHVRWRHPGMGDNAWYWQRIEEVRHG